MSRLIDADALKKNFGYTDEWYKSRTVTQIIDNAPTIDSLDLDVHIGGRCCGKRQRLLDELRPKGEWEYNPEWDEYMCPFCLAGFPKEYNFCPNCGADMRDDVCSLMEKDKFAFKKIF